MNKKYIVFKSEDWEKLNLWETDTEVLAQVELIALPDAEVIRRQDVTAAPVFHVYASIIHSFLEVAQQQGTSVDYEGLRTIADYFHEAAVDSESLEFRKLPD